MARAVVNQIQLTRNQLATLSKDPEIIRQLERLIEVSNLTGFGQSQVEADTVLDSTGVTLVVLLPRGRYFVDLVVMVDVVGGGGGVNGWTVTDASTATIAAGSYALFVAGPFGSGGGSSARPGPYGVVDTTACYTLRGFIDVQQPGVVGFTIAETGAPTSATLLAGSGMTTTLQRGVQ